MEYNSYEIADIIGVNVSTIKRWTNTGKLSCFQSIGGHRKFHLSHITDFLKKNNNIYTDIDLTHLVGKNSRLINAINNYEFDYLIQYSYKNLISGDKTSFLSLNNSLILKGYSSYLLFDKMILPILIQIGEEWSKGKLSITEEHLASEIIRKYLSNLNYQHFPSKTTYNAFCFTLINDKHDIPLHMAESIMNQFNKIKTFNLGSSLPITDFIKLSEKIHPDIIYISIIYIEKMKVFNREIKTLCNNFIKSNTKIYFSGTGTDKIITNHNNFLKINSYESLDLEISKHFK